MKVYFIGAGPGDPDLITVKGLRLIKACQICLYAGSLVPESIIKAAPKDGRIIDTAALTLDDIIDEMVAAQQKGLDVARVHSGDPSLYGAIAEQMRRLDGLGISYEIVPGVSAYAAAAAALKIELTIPEINQSIILTRTAMKSSKMPDGESLENFARTNATLIIHLSVRNLRQIKREISPFYGLDCPVILAYRVGWPDESFIFGTLEDIHEKAMAQKITRTALIMVGRGLSQTHINSKDFKESALYHQDHVHVLRPIAGRKQSA